MKDRLRFHFGCYALVQIALGEDGEPPKARIVGGFYPSHKAAFEGSACIEDRRKAENDAYNAKRRSVYGPRAWTNEYEPLRYEVIPLASVEFESLENLESDIAASALNRHCGIGKLPEESQL